MSTRLEAGIVFAGYEVEAVVGRGGMGVVYRARDPALERSVALKVVAPELAEDSRFRERFLRESRLAASIEHPHILPVHSAGQEGGVLYLASRYVDGEDMRARLAREGSLEPGSALELVGQIGSALDVAHERGLVHRDVKPANVLLDRKGEAYLADFGLAKPVASESGPTRTGELVGTLEYLAPEQIRSGQVDGRADQYALACILYQCLAGEPPFVRDGGAQLLWAHMQDSPPSLHERRPSLPAALDFVIARALAKEPQERYESCAAFIAAARSALGLEGGARPGGRTRGRLLIVLGVLITAGAVAAALAIVLTGSGDRATAQPAGAGAPVATEGLSSATAPAVAVPRNSVAVIDPQTNKLVSSLPVGANPGPIVVADGSVWIAKPRDRTVLRVDAETLEVVATVGLGFEPTGMAADSEAVWVAGGFAHALWRIDTADSAVRMRLEVPELIGPLPEGYERGPSAVAVGEGAVWLAHGEEVSRIDPSTGAVTATIPAGGSWSGLIAAGEGGVWVVGNDRRVVREPEGGVVYGVTKIDPATNSVVAVIPLVTEPTGLATGEGSVWATVDTNDTLWEIDPVDNVVTSTMRTGQAPRGVAIGEGSVWVTNTLDRTISRTDPYSNEVVATIPVPRSSRIATGEGYVWVTVI